MHRSALFSALAVVALQTPTGAQPNLTRENGRWVHRIYGSAAARQRLRVNAHGPVTLEAGVSKDLSYVITLTVSARSESEARRLLQHYAVRTEAQGQWMVLTAPGGPVMAAVEVKTPGLSNAVISTSEGAVQATGIEGALDVDSGAGDLSVDRVQGDCKLITGGGGIRVGQVGGSLRCSTGAGHIRVRSIGGE